MNALPQVIKRGDSYVIHNMDLTPYTKVQKIGIATLVWDQVRVLMEASGEYKPRDLSKMGSSGIGKTTDIDRVVAEMLGISWSQIKAIRPRLNKRPDVLEKVLSGEITRSDDVRRALGMRLRSKLTEGAVSKAKAGSGYFGHGDKFDEALEPLVRYVDAWRKRGFTYPHVPPREARKRVAKLDKVIAGLEEARVDLGKRSHVATLRAPHERTRKERS